VCILRVVFAYAATCVVLGGGCMRFLFAYRVVWGFVGWGLQLGCILRFEVETLYFGFRV